MKQTLIANRTNYDAPWAADFLRSLFHPGMKAVILPPIEQEGWASERDAWLAEFGRDSDHRYDMERPLRSYGIREFVWWDGDSLSLEHLFSEIEEADVLVIFGDDPHPCMRMLEDTGLDEAVKQFDGVLVVLSEAAQIVTARFGERYEMQEGLGLIQGASLCMHYDESEAQMRKMIHTLETQEPHVLVLSDRSGVYFEEGHIELLGDAFIAEEEDLEELYALIA